MIERIETRTAQLGGGLTIRRALPTPRRRMVGAWCFLDQAGPMSYGRGGGIAVGPHPHIGLQTFTWVVEGEIFHRDSLGFEQIIRPGQVNLMTAGRGISHAEDAVTDAPGRLHLAQLWIALPESERDRAPSFHHYPELPVVSADGFSVTVLAGTALGHTAPTEVFTPLLGLDLTAAAATRTHVPLQARFEHAALVLSGAVDVEGERLEPGTLLYLGTGRERISLACDAAARLLLIGGQPFEEEVLLWWNFVGRSPQEIAQATQDWNEGDRFGEVRGSPSPRLVAPALAGFSLARPQR
jgi:quercetin 2,3-dioxygenase